MDLGTHIADVKGPRAHVIIFGGVFLIAWGLLLGYFEPPFFALTVAGVLIVVAGAINRPVRIYERGITRGRKRIPYECLRYIHDGSLVSRDDIAAGINMNSTGAALIKKVDAYLILGDGSPFSVIRIVRSQPTYDLLHRHVLPAAVASWRARLDRGESYKVPASIVELKKDECWAPSPDRGRQPVLLPFRDTRIEGMYAFRDGRPDPVAKHVALGSDLLLRALVASYGVPVI